MGVRDLHAGPGEPQKATEGSRDRIEHSGGKGIKLLLDKRDNRGAVATEHRLEARIIGKPYIDALAQQCYGCRIGGGADQGQKLCNRCGSTWGVHGSHGPRDKETHFTVFSTQKLAKAMPKGQPQVSIGSLAGGAGARAAPARYC